MRSGEIADTAPTAVSHNPRIRKRVMVPRGVVPTLMQAARAEFPPGEIANAHVHPDLWELFICEAGEGTMRVDTTEVPLRRGSWVLVEPGERHELVASEGGLTVTVFGVAPTSTLPGTSNDR